MNLPYFVLASLFEIALPFVVGMILAKKFGCTWKVFLAGMLTFLVSQIVRTPLVVLRGQVYSASGVDVAWSRERAERFMRARRLVEAAEEGIVP